MAYESGGLFSVIDKRISSYPSEYMEKFLKLALKFLKFFNYFYMMLH